MMRFLIAAALTIAPAFAQGLPTCDGDYSVVRVSTVKPGKMQAFLKAVADHKQWYRSHGIKDNIIVASRVVERDSDTHALRYSETEIVTLHIHTPADEGQHDAAWDAFVAEYRDASDIKSEYRTCMPKLVP